MTGEFIRVNRRSSAVSKPYSFSSSAASAVVRKNVAPASSRQTVLLTQKELSRLTCRRDAGATILSHDLCLRGETGRLAAAGSLSESHHEVPGGVFIGI